MRRILRGSRFITPFGTAPRETAPGAAAGAVPNGPLGSAFCDKKGLTYLCYKQPLGYVGFELTTKAINGERSPTFQTRHNLIIPKHIRGAGDRRPHRLPPSRRREQLPTGSEAVHRPHRERFAFILIVECFFSVHRSVLFTQR
jgi:hypothetical protein